MKTVTEIYRLQKPTNCNGPLEWFNEQDFEIEESNVGQDYENYLGYKHATYRFRRDDIGRHTRVTSQGAGYRCWSFTLD